MAETLAADWVAALPPAPPHPADEALAAAAAVEVAQFGLNGPLPTGETLAADGPVVALPPTGGSLSDADGLVAADRFAAGSFSAAAAGTAPFGSTEVRNGLSGNEVSADSVAEEGGSSSLPPGKQVEEEGAKFSAAAAVDRAPFDFMLNGLSGNGVSADSGAEEGRSSGSAPVKHVAEEGGNFSAAAAGRVLFDSMEGLNGLSVDEILADGGSEEEGNSAPVKQVAEEGLGRSGERAEIDTSAPFQSVKAAVDHFGGGALWSSRLAKQVFASRKNDDLDAEATMSFKSQSAKLEKELIVNERSTLDVLKELEVTKRIVSDLSLKIQKEEAAAKAVFAPHPPDLTLMELDQAKVNLCHTTTALTALRHSIELLNTQIAEERVLLERRQEKLSCNASLVSSLESDLNHARQKLRTLEDLQRRRNDPSDIFVEIKKMTRDVEQLRTAANAAKQEAKKFAAEVDETKNSIGTKEVHCVAARKMEEASRASEAVWLTEIRALSISNDISDDQDVGAVTLSLENYTLLACKAGEADELSRKRIDAAMLQVDDANGSKLKLLKELETARRQAEQYKTALEAALKRVEAANRGKLAAEEALRKLRSEHIPRRSSIPSLAAFKTSAGRHHRGGPDRLDDTDTGLENSSPPVTLSIGEILSRKLVMADDDDGDEHEKQGWVRMVERPNVSLGQILNRKQVLATAENVPARSRCSAKHVKSRKR